MSELEKDPHLQETEARGRQYPAAAGAIPSEARAQPTPVTEVARGPVDSALHFVNLSIRSRAKEPRGCSGRPAFTTEKPASSSWSESYFPSRFVDPQGDGAGPSVQHCAVACAGTGADKRVSIQLTETADGCVSVPRSECTSDCCCAPLQHALQALRPSLWEHLHKS